MAKYYKCKKPNSRHAIASIKKPVAYSPSFFGFKGIDGDGLGVKICIIDSGKPDSSFLQIPIAGAVDFTSTQESDMHGHATGVGGILTARATGNIAGMIPQCRVWYAKGIKNDGTGDHGSIQASILYAIVNTVDIIVMSFGSETAHPSLQDAIRKAYKSNICIFAAAGNDSKQTKDANFPARLSEVMSVGLASKGSKVQIVDHESPAIDLNIKSVYTTYLNDQFIKMSGSSVAAPAAAGVAACIIQKYRNEGKKISPTEVYQRLMDSAP